MDLTIFSGSHQVIASRSCESYNMATSDMMRYEISAQHCRQERSIMSSNRVSRGFQSYFFKSDTYFSSKLLSCGLVASERVPFSTTRSGTCPLVGLRVV